MADDGKKPSAPPTRLAWLRTFLVVVTACIVPLALWYFLYAINQGENADRRGYRALARVRSGMHASTELLARMAATRAWRADGSASTEKISDATQDLKRTSWMPQGTKVDFELLPAPDVSAPFSTAVNVTGRTAAPRLRIELHYRHDQPTGIAAAVLLQEIVDPSLAGGEFDGLLIRLAASEPARANGGGDSGARDGLLVVGGHLPADALAAIEKREATLCTTSKSAPDEKGGGHPETSGSGPQLSGVPTVGLGRAQYNAFCLPVQLQTPEELPFTEQLRARADVLQFDLIGLVDARRLRQQALQLSPAVFSIVGFAAAAAFLSIPYLKIRFMARRERMRAVDIWLLGTAAFLGTGVAMLAILHAAGHHQLRADADTKMAELGKRMQQATEDEVALIRRQLETGAAALLKDHGCVSSKTRNDGSVRIGGVLLHAPVADLSFPYPDFEALFCTDKNGLQIRKWMPRSRATQLVPTANYPYFRRAMNMNAPTPFEFDVLDANTTGLRLAIFALPVDADASQFGPAVEATQRTGLAVLATRLHALMGAEVPPPYQYVVFRQRGAHDAPALLFSSAGTSFTSGDDLFDDVENPGTLREVIAGAGTAGSLPGDWRYSGRMHRMQAFKLDSLPATLLVYYDKTLIEGVAGEALTSAAFWLLLLTLLCLLGVVAASQLSTAALDRLWPTVRNWRLYRSGIIFFCAFAAALWLSLVGSPVWLRGPLVVGLPAALMFAHLLLPARMAHALGARSRSELSKQPETFSQAWRRRVHPRLYLALGVLGLLAFSAGPTTIVYRDALAAYRSAFEYFSSASYAQSHAERVAADWHRFAPLPDACGAQPQRADCQMNGIPITRTFFGEITNSLSAPDYTLWRLPDAVANPASHCTTIFSFSFGPLWPRTYFSALSAAFLPAVSQLNSALRSSLCAVDANAVPPTPIVPAAFLWVAGAMLIGILCVGLWSFVRSVAVHILGLNFEDDGVLDSSKEVLRDEHRRWLLLRPPKDALQALETSLKIKHPESLANWHPAVAAESPDAAAAPAVPNSAAAVEGPKLLIHAEAQLLDGAGRKLILDQLTAAHDGGVLLASAIDPLHFLTGRLLDAAENERADLATQVQSWAQVLSTMHKARYALPNDTGRDAGVPAAEKAARDRCVLDRLDDECQWDDRLLEIKQRLLAREDFSRLDWNEIIECVQDLAEPYYRMLWGLCSVEEKLTMIQLAQEGVVNPRAFDVLRRLRRRRLVRTDPRFRLMNESFKQFVLEAETTTQVRQWETPDPGQNWARLRAPLMAFLFVLTGILFYVQQPFFTSTIAVIAGAAGAASSLGAVVASARKAFSGQSSA